MKEEDAFADFEYNAPEKAKCDYHVEMRPRAKRTFTPQVRTPWYLDPVGRTRQWTNARTA